jgi:hypothetical protein
MNDKNTVSNNVLFDAIMCSDVTSDVRTYHPVVIHCASHQYLDAWCTINMT